jgi:hypothetical protein
MELDGISCCHYICVWVQLRSETKRRPGSCTSVQVHLFAQMVDDPSRIPGAFRFPFARVDRPGLASAFASSSGVVKVDAGDKFCWVAV